MSSAQTKLDKMYFQNEIILKWKDFDDNFYHFISSIHSKHFENYFFLFQIQIIEILCFIAIKKNLFTKLFKRQIRNSKDL